ncbi:MAG: beta-propeller domain-containing protein [Ruminococcus sp.]|jgi:inhibitor of cysteine peptidase
MKDYSVLEKIKNSADSCDIPENIKPENLNFDKPEKNGDQKKRRFRRGWLAGTAAAALVLVGALAFMAWENQNGQGTETGTTSAETVSENDTGEISYAEEGKKDLNELYVQAEDYDEVYEKLISSEERSVRAEAADGGLDMEDQAVEESIASSDMASSGSAASYGGDYAQTNVQTEGVDEGDVVKTDGQYLYVIRDERDVQIVKIDSGAMEGVSVIRPELKGSENSIRDIYLTGDTLQVICQRYDADMEADGEDTYYMNYRGITGVYTYDLSDRRNPRLTGTVEQEGTYYTSRKSGEYLYLFTSVYPEDNPLTRNDAAASSNGIIPLVNGEAIAASDIYIPRDQGGSEYILITSVSSETPDQITDQKAIMESASRFYVSTENIYLQREKWEQNGDDTQTAIAKFSFSNGEIRGESAAVIGGSVTDDFAVNEYEGYLRVLTTGWRGNTQTNTVYVLDSGMKITGKIEGLAEGESIYSARFMGNTGYFVTYRQVDPLFSVDFSDPENPRILGELKITGFSEYLHFYGENRLLGIGWETDPDTGVREGLKLSMFDVSDPSNVKEINKLVIKNIDYFPGEYNYKAFTVSPEKNVIGFASTSYESSGTVNSYMVFSYNEEEGFSAELTYGLQDGGSGQVENARGVYAGNTFYVVNERNVASFDMNLAYEKNGELEG